MPRNRGQSSRRSKAAASLNQSRLLEISKSENIIFGQIIKNLGARWMQAVNQDGTEVVAHIPNSLAHRTATPIRSGDIVILLARDYEVRASGEKKYEIFAVVQDKKQIREHIRDGRIPTWMLDAKGIEEDATSDVVEFDYAEGEDNDAETEIDIDKI
jgi:translation initiation factor IF-1